MDKIDVVLQYMNTYGSIFLFVIVYCEYLNLPGFPAGIIMPAAGVLIARGNMNFIYALILSVIAGILGSYTIYALGYYVGHPFIDKLYNRYKKIRPSIDKSRAYLERYGNKGIFVSRLIPVARTLISLIAGTARMELGAFTLYSLGGITIWNLVFILMGYVGGLIGK